MRTILLLTLLVGSLACQHQPKRNSMTNPTVTIRTNVGDLKVELFQNKAPDTVENFMTYVNEKHYDQTIFHRVIDGFMIQGGGFTDDMKQKSTHQPIRNEAHNKLSNQRGTLAMARTSDVHSATNQFFINVSDNEFLDYKNSTPSGYGYCVFGQVIEGMDVVDKIKKTKTGNAKGHQDVPVETIKILEITKDS